MPARLAAPALTIALVACQLAPPASPVPVERPVGENWRAIALPADAARIDALAAAAPSSEPALPRAVPPPGSYHCRLNRRGGGTGRRAPVRYPVHFCHVGVEGALLSFAKQTGSERSGGYLYADSDTRLIFLGATVTGAAAAPAYGADPARDRAGIFERVGPMRYRLVLPRDGGGLDMIELAPISGGLR